MFKLPTPKSLDQIERSEVISDRERMKQYWVKHSANANIQEMLLDSNAELISDHEMPEILSILPSIKSKRILELGAGIGRFTRVLAQQASHVTAVDFIEKFVVKNQELNSDLDNISFVHGDATKLEFPKNSFDMIFSNWLLMYLTEDEVLELIENSLYYIKEGGHFFFRESCFHQSGDIKKVGKEENPTEYRSPTNYVDFFQSKVVENENGCKYGFELVFARPNRTYIELKNNSNQVCFLFQKVKLTQYHHGFRTMKEFLDFKQYSVNSILRYERIYGEGFVSTGGPETAMEFYKQLDLKPNNRVLDIGCAIGGGDFLMSELYGVEVFGLDLSSNAIGICWNRSLNHKNSKCRFEIGDVTKQDYPHGYFDVIYSRDSLLHIEDKKSLFSKLKLWLKPGGKVFFTDYICGPKPWSDEFSVYVDQRGYYLLTLNEYKALIKDSGFVKVRAEDRTDMFIDYLYKELENFEKTKDDFVKEFSMQDYRFIVDGWKEKLVRTKDGHQKWGLFYAEKQDIF